MKTKWWNDKPRVQKLKELWITPDAIPDALISGLVLATIVILAFCICIYDAL